MDTHWIFDAASIGYLVLTGIGTLIAAIVGLKIKNAILSVGGRIDVHVAECNLIREETHRRLKQLEERVEHGA